MASGGVNIKMGVSGVSDVKKDINAVKESLRTLDKQLKLTETQFQNTGDKEAYLQEKSELLKGKLQGLQDIADAAKSALEKMSSGGVDKSSRAFQDMQRTLLDAKTQILETQGQIDALGTSEDTAGEKADGLNTKLEGIGKNVSVKNVTDAIDKITGSMEKAARKAIKLGETLARNVLGAAEWADELKTTAAQWEIGTDELQQIRKTAEIIDTEAETILTARQRMMKTLAGKEGKKTLEETLGISLNGQSAEDLFWEVGEALMNMDASFDKEAAATKLFGKNWRELLPLFTAGRDEYEQLNESWAIVSEEQLASLGKMDDEYQKLQANLETLKMTALAEFAEPMAAVMEKLNGLMGEFGKWLDSEEGRATVDNVVSTITDALQWVVDNKETAIAALKGIVAAWAGLKLTGGLLQLYQLVTGLKGLGLIKSASTAAAGAGAAGGGGGITGMIGSFISSGAMAPLSVLGTAILPALLANSATYSQAREKQQRRVASASSLTDNNAWFLESAANALGITNGRLQDYGAIESLLMGLSGRGDLEKMKLHNMLSGSFTSEGNDTWNELMRLWGGEEMDMGRLASILESVTAAYERAADLAEQSRTEENKNNLSSTDAKSMTDAVTQIPKAVSSGLSSARVVMDGTVVGRLVAGEVSRQIANYIQ